MAEKRKLPALFKRIKDYDYQRPPSFAAPEVALEQSRRAKYPSIEDLRSALKSKEGVPLKDFESFGFTREGREHITKIGETLLHPTPKADEEAVVKITGGLEAEKARREKELADYSLPVRSWLKLGDWLYRPQEKDDTGLYTTPATTLSNIGAVGAIIGTGVVVGVTTWNMLLDKVLSKPGQLNKIGEALTRAGLKREFSRYMRSGRGVNIPKKTQEQFISDYLTEMKVFFTRTRLPQGEMNISALQQVLATNQANATAKFNKTFLPQGTQTGIVRGGLSAEQRGIVPKPQVPTVGKVKAGLWDTYNDYGVAIKEAQRLRVQGWEVEIKDVEGKFQVWTTTKPTTPTVPEPTVTVGKVPSKLPVGLKKPIESLSTAELEKRIETTSPHVKLYQAELDKRAEALITTTPIGELKPKQLAESGIREIAEKLRSIKTVNLPLEYKQRVQSILKGYDLAIRTKGTLRGREGLVNYISKLEKEGLPVNVPQKHIDLAYKVPLTDMTIEQVNSLAEIVKGLVKQGQLKNRLLRIQAVRRVDEAEQAITEYLGMPDETGIVSKATFDKSFFDTIVNKYKGFIARTDRIERILFAMDGYEEDGLMQQVFYAPVNAATDQKLLGQQRVTDAFRDFLKEKNINLGKVLSNKQEIAPGHELTSSERIGVYLHSQNTDNRLHLIHGNQMSEATIDKVMAQMTPEELEIARWLSNYFRESAPEISAVRTEVEGKSLDVTENYFPIIAESRAPTTYAAQERKLIEDSLQDFGAELAIEDQYRFTSRFASSQVGKQFIKARTHKAIQPIKLDAIEIFLRRMEGMEHYKAFAPVIRDLDLLLNRVDIQRAITKAAGKPTLEVLNQWVRDVAKTNPLGFTSYGENMLRTMRTNAVTAVLGVNLTTAMKQFPSFLIGASQIGNAAALKGIYTYAANPAETHKLIRELAPQIFKRSVEREVAEAKAWKSIEKKLLDKMSNREVFMVLTTGVDRFTVNSLWRGAYDDFLAKNPDQVKEAAEYATKAIRRTQPFFAIKDLPEYWRSSEFMKALTSFTNQLNQNWNFYRHDTYGAGRAGKIGFGTVAKRVIEGFIGSAIMIGWITASEPPEDARDIVDSLAVMSLSMIPIAGLFLASGYQGFFTDSGMITTEVLAQLQEFGYRVNRGEWGKVALLIPELAGYIAGVPVAQPKRTLQGIYDLATGKTDDWMEIIWGAYRREEARKGEKKTPKSPEKKSVDPGTLHQR